MPGVDHSARGDALRAGRCGICLSRPGLELELAHRARLLDHIWAAQPFVYTRGDAIGERAAAAGAAIAVAPGDAGAAADALERLLSDDDAWRTAQAAAGALRAELRAARPYDAARGVGGRSRPRSAAAGRPPWLARRALE